MNLLDVTVVLFDEMGSVIQHRAINLFVELDEQRLLCGHVYFGGRPQRLEVHRGCTETEGMGTTLRNRSVVVLVVAIRRRQFVAICFWFLKNREIDIGVP